MKLRFDIPVAAPSVGPSAEALEFKSEFLHKI